MLVLWPDSAGQKQQ
ncbi:hypothetical protein CIB84_011008 [Bambusicola thoracicus]|uniref:Uncharacterized protein n=1 Tax=Bambusicola thoracicus TaxID=9083 RepID=A0A2P4SMB4_BAMTH|nr:hypothetical protein CIB84_011008 [Bambusicola thoracicus]